MTITSLFIWKLKMGVNNLVESCWKESFETLEWHTLEFKSASSSWSWDHLQAISVDFLQIFGMCSTASQIEYRIHRASPDTWSHIDLKKLWAVLLVPWAILNFKWEILSISSANVEGLERKSSISADLQIVFSIWLPEYDLVYIPKIAIGKQWLGDGVCHDRAVLRVRTATNMTVVEDYPGSSTIMSEVDALEYHFPSFLFFLIQAFC